MEKAWWVSSSDDKSLQSSALTLSADPYSETISKCHEWLFWKLKAVTNDDECGLFEETSPPSHRYRILPAMGEILALPPRSLGFSFSTRPAPRVYLGTSEPPASGFSRQINWISSSTQWSYSDLIFTVARTGKKRLWGFVPNLTLADPFVSETSPEMVCSLNRTFTARPEGVFPISGPLGARH
jgi:hypothetical protein